MSPSPPLTRSPSDFGVWFANLSMAPVASPQVRKMSSNFYAILGVPPTASVTEIGRAYRKAALQWHPDKWATASDPERQAALERFQIINAAHEELTDPVKRAAYDEHLKTTETPESYIMSIEQAWFVFARVSLQSVREEMLGGEPSVVAILKLVASLSLPSAGFYFGGSAAGFATNALSLLLLNPSGFDATLKSLSHEQKREFYCAALRLAQAAAGEM